MLVKSKLHYVPSAWKKLVRRSVFSILPPISADNEEISIHDITSEQYSVTYFDSYVQNYLSSLESNFDNKLDMDEYKNSKKLGGNAFLSRLVKIEKWNSLTVSKVMYDIRSMPKSAYNSNKLFPFLTNKLSTCDCFTDPTSFAMCLHGLMKSSLNTSHIKELLQVILYKTNVNYLYNASKIDVAMALNGLQSLQSKNVEVRMLMEHILFMLQHSTGSFCPETLALSCQGIRCMSSNFPEVLSFINEFTKQTKHIDIGKSNSPMQILGIALHGLQRIKYPYANGLLNNICRVYQLGNTHTVSGDGYTGHTPLRETPSLLSPSELTYAFLGLKYKSVAKSSMSVIFNYLLGKLDQCSEGLTPHSLSVICDAVKLLDADNTLRQGYVNVMSKKIEQCDGIFTADQLCLCINSLQYLDVLENGLEKLLIALRNKVILCPQLFEFEILSNCIKGMCHMNSSDAAVYQLLQAIVYKTYDQYDVSQISDINTQLSLFFRAMKNMSLKHEPVRQLLDIFAKCIRASTRIQKADDKFRWQSDRVDEVSPEASGDAISIFDIQHCAQGLTIFQSSYTTELSSSYVVLDWLSGILLKCPPHLVTPMLYFELLGGMAKFDSRRPEVQRYLRVIYDTMPAHFSHHHSSYYSKALEGLQNISYYTFSETNKLVNRLASSIAFEKGPIRHQSKMEYLELCKKSFGCNQIRQFDVMEMSVVTKLITKCCDHQIFSSTKEMTGLYEIFNILKAMNNCDLSSEHICYFLNSLGRELSAISLKTSSFATSPMNPTFQPIMFDHILVLNNLNLSYDSVQLSKKCLPFFEGIMKSYSSMNHASITPPFLNIEATKLADKDRCEISDNTYLPQIPQIPSSLSCKPNVEICRFLNILHQVDAINSADLSKLVVDFTNIKLMEYFTTKEDTVQLVSAFSFAPIKKTLLSSFFPQIIDLWKVHVIGSSDDVKQKTRDVLQCLQLLQDDVTCYDPSGNDDLNTLWFNEVYKTVSMKYIAISGWSDVGLLLKSVQYLRFDLPSCDSITLKISHAINNYISSDPSDTGSPMEVIDILIYLTNLKMVYALSNESCVGILEESLNGLMRISVDKMHQAITSKTTQPSSCVPNEENDELLESIIRGISELELEQMNYLLDTVIAMAEGDSILLSYRQVYDLLLVAIKNKSISDEQFRKLFTVLESQVTLYHKIILQASAYSNNDIRDFLRLLDYLDFKVHAMKDVSTNTELTRLISALQLIDSQLPKKTTNEVAIF